MTVQTYLTIVAIIFVLTFIYGVITFRFFKKRFSTVIDKLNVELTNEQIKDNKKLIENFLNTNNIYDDDSVADLILQITNKELQ